MNGNILWTGHKSKHFRTHSLTKLYCTTNEVTITIIVLHISFSFSRGEAGQFSLCCMATFVIFSFVPCCWPSLSTFLPPLPFLDLSSHNPPILAVVFLVLCNIPVSLSQIFAAISYLSFWPCVKPISPGYLVNYTS